MSTATSLGCTVHHGVARLPSALSFNGVARIAEAESSCRALPAGRYVWRTRYPTRHTEPA